MKDLIVLAATIILGIFIFGLIAGDDNSIKSAVSDAWKNDLGCRNYVNMVDMK